MEASVTDTALASRACALQATTASTANSRTFAVLRIHAFAVHARTTRRVSTALDVSVQEATRVNVVRDVSFYIK